MVDVAADVENQVRGLPGMTELKYPDAFKKIPEYRFR